MIRTTGSIDLTRMYPDAFKIVVRLNRKTQTIKLLSPKEKYINLIKCYNINRKVYWHGIREEHNCTTILHSDIINIFNYGSYERGKEIYQRDKSISPRLLLNPCDYPLFLWFSDRTK